MSAPHRLSSRPPAPPGLPGPGDTLGGKYVVERLLGVGGMGAVLAARHVELDERVAIKMLLPTISPQGEPGTRFIREARAAIKIRNEHVVRILDVARLEDGAPYIVMEYLEGTDLARLTDEAGPLKVDDAIEYVVQACEAIAAAHALGIVHRDLKPANLFLTRTGDGRPCVKVLDFGISKIAEGSAGGGPGLTSTTTIMGTPCFMSPEQLRSTRDVDARADIWSIGAILHSLLTGIPPYDGESNADVSAKIIRDAPTPVRELRAEAPPELEAIILRCLEKDPSARYADVAELARELAGVTARDSVKVSAARVARGSVAAAPTLASTHPPPAAASGPTRTASAWGETGRGEKQPDRSWRVVGVLAAAIAVVAIAALGLGRLDRPSPPPVVSASAAPPPVVATTTTEPVATAPIASASASAPSATPSATAAAATTTHPAGPPARRLSPAATTAKPGSAPPPAPTHTAGLFDGRQ